uniref:Uncharacterized protein n=1 Tax=Mycena chlorophos TaxID=658473 RepID=A0ABQ0LKI2_MYCCL|nr:predicted protein [Mycena chlorophos]
MKLPDCRVLQKLYALGTPGGVPFAEIAYVFEARTASAAETADFTADEPASCVAHSDFKFYALPEATATRSSGIPVEQAAHMGVLKGPPKPSARKDDLIFRADESGWLVYNGDEPSQRLAPERRSPGLEMMAAPLHPRSESRWRMIPSNAPATHMPEDERRQLLAYAGNLRPRQPAPAEVEVKFNPEDGLRRRLELRWAGPELGPGPGLALPILVNADPKHPMVVPAPQNDFSTRVAKPKASPTFEPLSPRRVASRRIALAELLHEPSPEPEDSYSLPGSPLPSFRLRAAVWDDVA